MSEWLGFGNSSKTEIRLAAERVSEREHCEGEWQGLNIQFPFIISISSYTVLLFTNAFFYFIAGYHKWCTLLQLQYTFITLTMKNNKTEHIVSRSVQSWILYHYLFWRGIYDGSHYFVRPRTWLFASMDKIRIFMSVSKYKNKAQTWRVIHHHYKVT